MGESYEALPTLIVIAAAAGLYLLGRWITRKRHGVDDTWL